MGTIATYLCLASALIFHLIADLHKEKVKHPIIHWLGALIVCGISVALGFANQLASPEYQWWQFTIYSLCIHLALFDPIWNIANKNPWYYSGSPSNPKRAWTDKFWQMTPPLAQPLFRFIILFAGYSVYYNLDQIIGS